MQQFGDYCRAGWALCYIAPGDKSPTVKGWQQRDHALTNAEMAEHFNGCGLLHAYSGTCVLDIDDFAEAEEWLLIRGIDLRALWDHPDAVKLSSGRPNRGKLLYKLDTPLRSKKIISGKANIIDFRCATRTGLSVQDVLPPSIHPNTGKPYVWVFNTDYAHWARAPQLPADVRALWESLISPEHDKAPEAPTGADADAIRQVLALKDPDCDRDSWVTILAAIHEETQGAEWGLALADEWSRKGQKYSGFGDVEERWYSFTSGKAGNATMGQDLALVATDDEFAPVPEPTPAEVQTQEAQRDAEIEQGNKTAKQKAKDILEKSLVYVRQLDRYMDVKIRFTLPGDHAVRHTYSSMMPFTRSQSGAKSRIDPVKMLQDSATKQVADVPGFHPGADLFFTEDGIRYVNEYIKDSVVELVPTALELEKIEWLFNRIDDPIFRKWLLQFYGHAIQKPGVKIFSAPLIWSEMTGNGKSTLLQEIPQLLFGMRYSVAVSNSMLASDFNDYLVGKWFVHLSEMHADAKGERHSIAGKLKAWITDALSINVKGSRGYTTRNSLIVTAASNKSEAAAIENNDRRWGVHELTAARMTEAEGIWFHDEFLKTPRATGVLRHYFARVNLKGFYPTAPAPETASREAMIRASLPVETDLLLDAIEEARGPFVRDVASIQEIAEYLRTSGLRYLISPHRLGYLLRGAPLNCQEVRIRKSDGQRIRLWVCRNHTNWVGAPGKAVEAHWIGDNDPLTA